MVYHSFIPIVVPALSVQKLSLHVSTHCKHSHSSPPLIPFLRLRHHAQQQTEKKRGASSRRSIRGSTSSDPDPPSSPYVSGSLRPVQIINHPIGRAIMPGPAIFQTLPYLQCNYRRFVAIQCIIPHIHRLPTCLEKTVITYQHRHRRPPRRCHRIILYNPLLLLYRYLSPHPRRHCLPKRKHHNSCHTCFQTLRHQPPFSLPLLPCPPI
jgi:hypothetical protein